NRCGIPLLEIVTEPDLHSGADAAALARQLKAILQYAGVSECDMELGSLRIDANVSVRDVDLKAHASLPGVGGRSEIKNLNSFSQLERAIDLEVARQLEMAAGGVVLANETLLWDADHSELRVLRRKEERDEYRYMDEPDLPVLVLDDALINRALHDLPEQPAAREARFWHALELPEGSAHALCASRELADYFESVVSAGASARTTSAWVLTHVLAWCNVQGSTIRSYPVPPSQLAAVLERLDAGRLTRDGARQLVAALEGGMAGDLDEVVERLGLERNIDGAAMAKWIDAVISEEAVLVAQYRAGAHNVFGFLMGRLMSAAGAGTDPRSASEQLRARLDGGY
ncbi:MAG: Asp-tRNA(Asn)/Glu-tRNA(Gln) amidotransferase GatCAB subunit B, partial [Longimicrobiales bacterium]